MYPGPPAASHRNIRTYGRPVLIVPPMSSPSTGIGRWCAAVNCLILLPVVAELHASRHLLRARDLADARYAEPLTVADLANEAALSVAHFSREFRRTFGEPPHRYLMTRRLERAAALLRTTDWPVARIAVSVGWESVGSFTTSFGRVCGMSPTRYRASRPAASRMAQVPACVVRAYARPPNRTFREDRASTAG